MVNEAHCELIFAKSLIKSLPDSEKAAPRLELQALVIGCKIAKFASKELEVP